MQVIGLVLLTTGKQFDYKQHNLTHKQLCFKKRVQMAPAVTTATSRTGSTSLRIALVHIIFKTFNTPADVSCDTIL
jgi:hypothetical protein